MTDRANGDRNDLSAGVAGGSRNDLNAGVGREIRHVVVMGGGPAGLAAGHELSARGVKVTVLERAPWVGGLSMTWERDGFRFDLGGHRWFTKKTWLNDWFVRLMEGELVSVRRISRIYFGGKYFDYPVALTNVLQTAGIFTSACLRSMGSMSSISSPPHIERAFSGQTVSTLEHEGSLVARVPCFGLVMFAIVGCNARPIYIRSREGRR